MLHDDFISIIHRKLFLYEIFNIKSGEHAKLKKKLEKFLKIFNFF